MAELQPGAAFAGYRIEALIGRGGMGLVYRAQDERLKRKVALKVLPLQKATDEAFRTRFIRESEAAASIDHPNIIPIFEAGEEAGGLFIAMRFVDGPDLKQYLSQHGPLSLDEATDLLDGVAGALDTAHAQGLVHRDIKPQNILISMGPASVASRHVYLTDFGLTKEKEAGREVTAEGQFVGTIDYVAPEQMDGRPLDGRADVYALGCVLYECLTGTVPFVRGSDVSTMLAHMREAPPSVRSNRPDLSPGTDDVIARALAKSPNDRHSTCRDLMKDLRQEAAVSSNDQRPEADRVVTGPNSEGTVVAPGGGTVAPAQGGTSVAPNHPSVAGNRGTVVAPSQPGVQAPPVGTAPMNQQPPPQGPSNPGWQQPPPQPQQPGPSYPGWQQPPQPGYGPPPTQPGPGGPGYGGPPPGGPGYGGPPPGGGGGSKAGLFIALGVVALLVVGGVAFALTRGGDDNPTEPVAAETTTAPQSSAPTETVTPSPEPSPSEDTGEDSDLGAFPNQFEQSLLSHLPEDFVDLCSRLEFDLPETANAAITCTPDGADFIGYVQYDRSDSMNRDYNKSVDDQGVIKNSGSAGCQNGSPSEGTYTRGKKTPGRLMCYMDGSEAWMDWTHDSLSIYTFASRSDGNLSKLFDFWINAGPFGRPIAVD